MGQGIWVHGGCILWLGSGSGSWRKQKPLGILLVLFYQTEENLLPLLPSSQLMKNSFVLKIQSCWLFLFHQIEHPRNGIVLLCSQGPSGSRSTSPDSPVSMKSLLKVESSCREWRGWGTITMSSATQKALVGQ